MSKLEVRMQPATAPVIFSTRNDIAAFEAAHAPSPATSAPRDATVLIGEDFRLESGEQLAKPVMRLRFFGRAGAPRVIVAGGISASRRVADGLGDKGWWRQIVAPGGAIDLNACEVIGFDFLPDGEDEGKAITAADQARALLFALSRLGVDRAFAFVGASYGALIGMALAAERPDFIERLCVISAAATPDPMATAVRGIQRRIIRFALECGRGADGVALARQLGMTTYRSVEEFSERFSADALGSAPGDPYDVCAYLVARGHDYATRVSAARYLTLSDSIDRSRVDASRISAETLFIAVANDRLVQPESIRATAAAVAGPTSFSEIASIYGHDAFLCETQAIAERLGAFLQGCSSDREK